MQLARRDAPLCSDVRERSELISWPIRVKPTHTDPPWRVATLPLYHDCHIVRSRQQTWSTITAQVVDIRSTSDVSALLEDKFTRVCITLEEVGGPFEIGSGSLQPKGRSPVYGATSVIPPNTRAQGMGKGLRFMRQLLLQMDEETLVTSLGDAVDVEQALRPRMMIPDPRVLRLGRVVADECALGTSISRAYSDSLSVALISALAGTDTLELNVHNSRGGLAPWQIRRVTDYLLQNLTEDLELSTQANLIGLSKSHFCRAFKASTGVSPHQWLLKARVERAKQHLLVSELPIAEVALTVGFADQAHFTRTFTRLEGVSPRAWQRLRYT